MPTNSGTNPDYPTQIPLLSESADVQRALKFVLYGGTDTTTNDANASAATGVLKATGKTDTAKGLVGHLNKLEEDLKNKVVTLYLHKTDFTAKGQILAGTGTSTFSPLAVGTDGYVLSASSGAATGLAWIDLSSVYLPLSAGASKPLTGNLHLSSTAPNLVINAASANNANLQLADNGTAKWNIYKNSSNDLIIDRAGVATALTVSTSTGNTTFANQMLLYGLTADTTINDSFSPRSGSMVVCNKTSGVQTFTISNNSLPVGTTFNFYYNSTGATDITFAQGANVSIQSPGGMKKLRTTYSVGTLVKHQDSTTDIWMLFGDLKT
jgi:hypothetical protein